MEQNQVIIFLMLALFGFLIWNSQRTSKETFVNVTGDVPVEPAIIQTIINAIQARDPDVYPVQTIYINSLQGSEGSQIYDARILFMNTRGYFGVQYDVQADTQGRLLKLEAQTSPYAQGPFMPVSGDKEYSTFEDIQISLDTYFASLKDKSAQYDSALGQQLDAARLQQRSEAMKQAVPGSAMLQSGAIEFAEQ
jgi:hypothetical protein